MKRIQAWLTESWILGWRVFQQSPNHPLNTLKSIYQCAWCHYTIYPPITYSNMSTLQPLFFGHNSAAFLQHMKSRVDVGIVLQQVSAPTDFSPELLVHGYFLVTMRCNLCTTPSDCSGSLKCSSLGASMQSWDKYGSTITIHRPKGNTYREPLAVPSWDGSEVYLCWKTYSAQACIKTLL